MKTALACDLDGTLIKYNDGPNNPRSVSKMDIERIQAFTQEHLFIVSTGRIKPLMFALFDELSYHPKNTYYIASNGAEVYDQNRKQLWNLDVSYEIVEKAFFLFVQHSTNHPLLFQVYDGIENYCLSPQDALPSLHSAISICIESKTEDIPYIQGLYEDLKQHLTDCEVSMNHWFINIVPPNISKATAIQCILNMQKEPYNLYAIGDSYNDVVMFDIAQESYTFHASPSDVKDKAKHLVNHVYECIDDILKKEPSEHFSNVQ